MAELCASTRTEEMKLVDWPRRAEARFLRATPYAGRVLLDEPAFRLPFRLFVLHLPFPLEVQ